MTRFEQQLIDKGYLKFILNCKTMKFEIAKGHTISSMVNLDHRYFLKSDFVILDAITNGKSIMDDDFPDRSGEIVFGLHERYKPPTLIYPRPNIDIKRTKNDKEIVENEMSDDSMNIILQKFDL